MKRSLLSLISLLLSLLMLGSMLASCKPSGGNVESETEGKTEVQVGTEKQEQTDAETSENNSESDKKDETASENTSEDISEDTTEYGGTVEVETEKTVEYPASEGKYGATISYANSIADGVQAFYNAERTKYTVLNKQVTIELPLSASGDLVIGSIKNSKGFSYIENTMDAFVTMSNGKTYYASASTASARPNIYKLGYYYYDIHLNDHNFLGDAEITATKDFMAKAVSGKHQVTDFKIKDDVVSYTVDGADPYVYTTTSTSNERFFFFAEEYNAIQVTVRNNKSKNGELYFIAGSHKGHSAEQRVSFTLIPDGEWHTYTLNLIGCTDFVGKVTGFRFDIGSSGETIELKDIKAVKIDSDTPNLGFDRELHTYSDKINQVMHFVANEETSGIKALGMVTRIDADTVAKLIVKDKNGTKTTLDGVDWASAEYIGFDIKNAGIFGYVLLAHENSGKLEVTLADGVYTITQSSAPEGGKMIPPDAKKTYTSNDFYMGHRLYTDETHTFDAFLIEAENERHPLQSISGSKYVGYDALVGAYKFNISGDGFNAPFFNSWNRHHESDITVVGGSADRNIYVYTYYDGGTGEGAAIMDENNMMLPIPTMIYKNFGGENEEPVFFAGDHTYSETYFPIVVKAGETTSLTVLNLYQNWGAFPLKQLSSIQYFWPYYHLSVGTTETSCISPWYGARDLWTLPDFRSISMPYWFELEGDAYSNQPQHTHGGYQYFLQYTDADGNYSATENIRNDIDSAGPVYAEVTMDYLSDDGKIKVSYTHIEYAQTDELRAYYEIEYEILEEVTINDFKNDFSFYSFEGYSGKYRQMGYLDENNEIVHKKVNTSDVKELIVLGDKNPYVALYDLAASGSWEKNNVNLGFVIAGSEFVFGGQKCNENFVITGSNAKYSLSLNLDKVTLKPGDTVKLNMVIVPWGWYNSTDDKNMQDVRENTCLDPLTVTVAEGEKMESVFVPRVKSTNGKSAEFTLSGASNNVAVRVYGFDKLTAPKIYEKVDGQWVEYVICSINNPDKHQNVHYYDGYNVYFDEDGTYSYAFTVNMDDVDSRTFKVEASEDFKTWPEIMAPVNEDAINVYLEPEELSVSAMDNTGIGKAELSANKDYVSFYGNDNNGEGFFTAYSANGDFVSGQYLIVKYRIPTSNSENTTFEVFTSTLNGGAVAGESFYFPACVKDGEWHIMIADLSKQNLPTYSADADGNYITKFVRLDVFSSKMSTESYVDIAYIGLCDNLNDLCELNGKSGTATLSVRGTVIAELDFATCTLNTNVGDNKEEEPEVPTLDNYIDPESGYTKSALKYKSAIDFINGKGDGDGAYDQRGGTSGAGIDVLPFDGPTVGEAYLAIAGWTAVDKGIAKYVWSADGGKTWKDCQLYNRDSFAVVDGNNGIIKVANNMFGYDYLQYQANSIYQGSEGNATGVAAKLTDYVGQTVNVIFAAVPATEPNALCLIAYITNVRVYASNEAASEGEAALETACNHSSAKSYTFIDDGDASTDEAILRSSCKCGEFVFSTSSPSYVMFFNKIGDLNVAPLVFETKNGYTSVNATAFSVSGAGKSFKTDAAGKLSISGWAGVVGGIKNVVFKVFDANGNELTSGWTNTNSEIKEKQSDLNPEMVKRNIEEKYGVRYSFTIDLSSYLASNSEITVKFAFENASAPEGSNDKYVYTGEFTNVSKP